MLVYRTLASAKYADRMKQQITPEPVTPPVVKDYFHMNGAERKAYKEAKKLKEQAGAEQPASAINDIEEVIEVK